ncbi:helix-turn-helix domain-containing protein [Novosphingobium aerophilum]|uniref:AraC family transcriptional regulator n=1 Tax=Novosphingobium aerophilum TaxID=2839843 RepID=A0A7X1KDF3_9SPHN|nr:helix-turn-helix domain-containing protein [Novosphingobium aerophilum]MBC2653256.1 AraC family transcriptional regulator [Novosphingobium aerophilum]
MNLVLGWRSASLLVAAAVLLCLAAALASNLRNRLANRVLGALIVTLVGVFTPWLIGFAGAYDQWPWLTFLPVAVPLLVPALLRLYVEALLKGALPRHWRVMLVPGLIEFGFQAISFCLPLDLKNRWADIVGATISPLFALALIASFALHIARSAAMLREYRAGLANVTGDEGRFAARWLTQALLAFALLWISWGGALLWDWVSPLGYKGLMWLYLLIAAVALFLAIEGWRHANDPFPSWDTVFAADTGLAPSPRRDWAQQAEEWAREIETAGWATDPDLDLARLARLLGTNTSYLSRALNEGLGVNFSSFVNGLRCKAVMAALAAGDSRDVLTITLDAGFSSKASFNRAFLACTGTTPSAWRKRVSDPGHAA